MKNLLKIITVILLIFLSMNIYAQDKLTFLTWTDYIDPELINEFEKEFNIKIEFSYFETDEDRDGKLAYTNGEGYDLIVLSGPYISHYVKRNWLSQIDLSKISNSKHINSQWINAYDLSRRYAVPYAWGTIGIAYRRDLIDQKIHSWKQLFNPDPRLKNKLGMINDSKETIGIALKALGYSLNSKNKEELYQAMELLVKQKPFVYKYTTPDLTENSFLVTGKNWMSFFYNGDALFLQQYNPNIVFIVPDEGTGLWVDYISISKSSPNKKLALAFINFINKPINAARNSKFLNYATTNKTAEKLLPDEHLNNPIIYPKNDVLSKSEFFIPLPAKTERIRNMIYSSIHR